MKGLLVFSQLLILPVFAVLPAHAQKNEQIKIDSIQKLMPFQKEDTNKVKLLNLLGHYYFTIDPDEGIRVSEKSISLAKELQYTKGFAAGLISLGSNYWAKDNFLKAQDYYWQSLKIHERLRDTTGIAKSLHAVAVTYESQYNFPKALEYYKKSLELNILVKHSENVLGLYSNIAWIYQSLEIYDSALANYQRSLDICIQQKHERNIAFMAGRIGLIYAETGNYDDALRYQFTSLNTFKKLNDAEDYAIKTGEIGEVYFKKKNYLNALKYFRTSVSLFERLKGNYSKKNSGKYQLGIGKTFLSMAIATSDYLKKKSLLQHSIYHLKAAIRTSRNVNDQQTMSEIFRQLAIAYELSGNPSLSLYSFKQHTFLRDSLMNAEKIKEMTRHELEYVYGKEKDSLNYLNSLQQSKLYNLQQTRRLETLKAKQEWLSSIIIFTFLLLMVSLFLFRYRLQKLKLMNQLAVEKADKKLKDLQYQRQLNDVTFSALRSQMNPHFIFNALNTIQSYVYSNDKKSATDYLGKFSELIRKTLEYSNKRLISLEEEINLLQLYIDIEKARFGKFLRAEIIVQQDVDSTKVMIPPMLIQPYVENAIKHGLLHISGEKKLEVAIAKSSDADYIEIKIEDWGIGREKSREINLKRMKHNSFALTANQQRVELISQLFEKEATIKIIDKKNEDGLSAGTKVILSLPLLAIPA